MSNLPTTLILGKLEFIEVYDYYDQPCLFSCKNLSGQIFISVWADSTDFVDIWLYAPVSTNRFKDIREGKVDLKDIFSNSEGSFVFEVSIPHHEDFPTEVKTTREIPHLTQERL